MSFFNDGEQTFSSRRPPPLFCVEAARGASVTTLAQFAFLSLHLHVVLPRLHRAGAYSCLTRETTSLSLLTFELEDSRSSKGQLQQEQQSPGPRISATGH